MSFYTFRLDQFRITNTRARQNDTDLLAINLKVGEREFTYSRQIGDVNHVNQDVGYEFPGIRIDDPKRAISEIRHPKRAGPVAVAAALAMIASTASLAVPPADASLSSPHKAVGALISMRGAYRSLRGPQTMEYRPRHGGRVPRRGPIRSWRLAPVVPGGHPPVTTVAVVDHQNDSFNCPDNRIALLHLGSTEVEESFFNDGLGQGMPHANDGPGTAPGTQSRT